MIIHSIRVRDFLSHVDSEVSFEDARLWLVSGENGAGKSALFDALEYALYGRHRGDNQHAKHLVRNGSSSRRAIIEIRLELNGDQYRLHHNLHRQEGNEGGQIYKLVDGAWQILNVPGGRRGTWDYLKQRLPEHELFRSAIFLRQGNVDHFLRGSPQKRINRFADLIGLARYTRLSKAARKRQGLAEDARKHAEGQRAGLGDTTDAALETAETAVTDQEGIAEQALTRLRAASAVTAGAKLWVALRADEARLAERRATVQSLLQDAAEIREAAGRVERWDRNVAALEGCLAARRHAAESATSASAAQELASAARGNAEQVQQHLDNRQERSAILDQTALPVARGEEQRLRAEQAALALEHAVARARVECETVQNTVDTLRGADERLAELKTSQAALGHLGVLLQAGVLVTEARAVVAEWRGKLAEAEQERSVAESAEEAAQDTLRVAVLRAGDAAERVRTLEQEAAGLRGIIRQRDQISGEEEQCPVCDQNLDADAHGRVQQALAEERARLEATDSDLVLARVAEREAGEAQKLAGSVLRTAMEARSKAVMAVALAEQALHQALEDANGADHGFTTALGEARERCGTYAGQIDDPSEPWLMEESTRVAHGLQEAERLARDLQVASVALLEKKAALSTYRGQRASGAVPLGDAEAPEALVTRLEDLERAALGAKEARELLDTERRELEAAVLTLTGELATARATVDSEERRAAQAESQAGEFRAEAMRLADGLGPDWQAVLESGEVYVLHRAEVEELRPLAARAGELARVDLEQGEIERVSTELECRAAALNASDALPVPVAEAAEERARAEDGEAREHLGIARVKLAQVEANRQEDARLAGLINEAARDERTFGTLSDLLKDDGPIQISLARREQRVIAEVVNSVLERLGDSLRVLVGATRRMTGAGLEDLCVVDLQDPSMQSKYFEYLSGGEQFRISLALALALHRRVGREPGTLIVDEGFGALDSRRRHDLAARLTETTNTILDRGLAHSVVICSHSEEVQRQFPHRWHVEKQGETATVTRQHAEGA